MRKFLVIAAAVLLALGLFLLLWVFCLFPNFFDPNRDVVDTGESPVGIVPVIAEDEE